MMAHDGGEPFRAYLVAWTRTSAYQHSVVMKYLDNLIAWGDGLFAHDTVESIGEASELYVLDANLLGVRPQPIPACHANDRRELEVTRHVSLRQLDPLALLKLKATGTCELTIPESLYDHDCPGHYMRRLKSIAVSLPSVVGPYARVNCTLLLLWSSLRRSPALKDDRLYARQGPEDVMGATGGQPHAEMG